MRTPRQAAPMQKRVLPLSRAAWARTMMSSFSISFSAFTPLEYRALCAQ